jgi:hypothetical protein
MDPTAARTALGTAEKAARNTSRQARLSVPLYLALAAANGGIVFLSYLIRHQGGPTLAILSAAVTFVAVAHAVSRPAVPRHARATQIVLTVGSSMAAVLMFTAGRMLWPQVTVLWVAGAAISGLLLAAVALFETRRRATT